MFCVCVVPDLRLSVVRETYMKVNVVTSIQTYLRQKKKIFPAYLFVILLVAWWLRAPLLCGDCAYSIYDYALYSAPCISVSNVYNDAKGVLLRARSGKTMREVGTDRTRRGVCMCVCVSESSVCNLWAMLNVRAEALQQVKLSEARRDAIWRGDKLQCAACSILVYVFLQIYATARAYIHSCEILAVYVLCTVYIYNDLWEEERPKTYF